MIHVKESSRHHRAVDELAHERHVIALVTRVKAGEHHARACVLVHNVQMSRVGRGFTTQIFRAVRPKKPSTIEKCSDSRFESNACGCI